MCFASVSSGLSNSRPISVSSKAAPLFSSALTAAVFTLRPCPQPPRPQRPPPRHRPSSRASTSTAATATSIPSAATSATCNYQPINPGAVVSAAGYFNRYLGIQAEGSFFPSGPNDCVFTAQAGPVVRFQKNRWVPFAHALVGGAKVGGPIFQPCTWGWGVTSGVGLDYILPAFNNLIAIRPIQADFDYSHVDYGTAGSRPRHRRHRQSSTPIVSPQASSSASARSHRRRRSNSAAPFSPRTSSPAIPSPHRHSHQSRSQKEGHLHLDSTGGHITGTDSTATISTANLAAGDYTVYRTRHRRPAPWSSRPPAPPASTSTPSSPRPSPARQTPAPSCRATPRRSPRSPPARRIVRSATPTPPPQARSPEAHPPRPSTPPEPHPAVITVTCNVVDDLGKQATAIHSGHHQLHRHRHRRRRSAISAASPSSATGSARSASTTKPRAASTRSPSPSTASPRPSWLSSAEHSADETPDAAAQRDTQRRAIPHRRRKVSIPHASSCAPAVNQAAPRQHPGTAWSHLRSRRHQHLRSRTR